MNEKATRKHDAFTFSLGGTKAIASFAFAPAIAHDRLRQRRDDKQAASGRQERRRMRLWPWGQRDESAQENCA